MSETMNIVENSYSSYYKTYLSLHHRCKTTAKLLCLFLSFLRYQITNLFNGCIVYVPKSCHFSNLIVKHHHTPKIFFSVINSVLHLISDPFVALCEDSLLFWDKVFYLFNYFHFIIWKMMVEKNLFSCTL